MRILLVHNSFRSFVRIDRDVLASAYEVDELDLSDLARVVSAPARVARADLVFNWFASLHSFFPSMLGAVGHTPVVSVVGAYDAADIPEINFGHMGHPWKKYVVRSICGVSSLLICNSEYAARTVRENVRPKAPIRVIHHGIEFPPPNSSPEREQLVISVGQIRQVNLARKGLEVFVRAAALVPEARFVLAGHIMDGSGEYLRSMAGSNVEVRDHVPQAELDDLYNRASVYVQASIHESFGLTVVEAMGAGCIPVVSRQGALPEVAGRQGIYVDESDVESVASGIRTALEATPVQRQTVARYARDTFPLSKRRACLLEAVDHVLPAQSPHSWDRTGA